VRGTQVKRDVPTRAGAKNFMAPPIGAKLWSRSEMKVAASDLNPTAHTGVTD
jgi:hypothetical protein